MGRKYMLHFHIHTKCCMKLSYSVYIDCVVYFLDYNAAIIQEINHTIFRTMGFSEIYADVSKLLDSNVIEFFKS